MTLRVKSISKRYTTGAGTVEALRDVSFSVRNREFVCLVGPSGCGKSTLLSLIAGLELPSRGTIDTRGTVGYIFQEPTLFPWLTVADNVAFSLKMNRAGSAVTAKSVDGALRLAHLEHFAKAYPHQLSGGMKQRAALARAIVRKPDILLMDEPFSAVDAIARENLYGDLQRIWKITGTTILFVTHNVREAVCLGDRVLVMSRRPGTICDSVPVPLARPRDIGNIRVVTISHDVKKKLIAGRNA